MFFPQFLKDVVLRVVNIAAVAGAFTQENTLLFAFFLWAMVPTIVHRMILTLNDNLGEGNNVNGVKYLRRSWFSPNSNRKVLGNTPGSNFNVVHEETVSVTSDSVF